MHYFITPFAAAAFLAAPALAHAQESLAPQSAAVGESAQGVAALGEAALKSVAGIVALPIMAAGGGSTVAGDSAQAVGESGQTLGAGAGGAANDLGDFASSPLTVTDVVVRTPQPAPRVPYAPAAGAR